MSLKTLHRRRESQQEKKVKILTGDNDIITRKICKIAASLGFVLLPAVYFLWLALILTCYEEAITDRVKDKVALVTGGVSKSA